MKPRSVSTKGHSVDLPDVCKSQLDHRNNFSVFMKYDWFKFSYFQ